MKKYRMSSHGFDTNHLLDVSVQDGSLEGCPMGDACRLWGSGILRVVNKDPTYTGHLILTGAGCEICPSPSITQGDIGIAGYRQQISATRESALSSLRESATAKLAEIVQSFAPEFSFYGDE